MHKPLAALALTLFAGAALAQATPVGVWKTIDDKTKTERAQIRIVEVDGGPTSDLDAFIAAVRGRADRSSLRLKTITWNGSTEVVTLKLDLHYWPTYELLRTAEGWERQPID